MKTEQYDIHGSTISIPIAESYKDCMRLIKSDRYRISGKMESTFSIFLHLLKPFAPSALFWLRLCQYKGWLWPFCRMMHLRACRKYQLELPPSLKIGYGFYIGHAKCMVITDNAIIGNNVNLTQFLNIGTNHSTPAIIGDNVYIGPQVCLVEDVKIGNNASIGAGAVVTKDVPENATVAGVPAKVLNYNQPGRFVNKRYKIE